MTPLRASAYTAHSVAAADRHTQAVIDAAGVWHDASRNLTDAENALQTAHDDGDEHLAGMLEYARESAAIYCEFAYQQVRTLVCGVVTQRSWSGRAGNGMQYLVTWSGPVLSMVSIVPQS